MIIDCPKCHAKIAVNNLGRKRLDMPVENVYDALLKHKTVAAAARALGVSRPFIYEKLKANGLKPKDVVRK